MRISLRVAGLALLLSCRDNAIAPSLPRSSDATIDAIQSACEVCIVQPFTLRDGGEGVRHEQEFSASPELSHELVVTKTSGVARIEIALNNQVVLAPEVLSGGSQQTIAIPLTVAAANHVIINFVAAPEVHLYVRIHVKRRAAAASVGNAGATVIMPNDATVHVPNGVLPPGSQISLSDTAPVYRRAPALSAVAYKLTIQPWQWSAVGTEGTIALSIPLAEPPPDPSRINLRFWLMSDQPFSLWRVATWDPARSAAVTQLSVRQLRQIATTLQLPRLSFLITADDPNLAALSTPAIKAQVTQRQTSTSLQSDPLRSWSTDLPVVGADEYPLRLQPESKGPVPGDIAIIMVHGWLRGIRGALDFRAAQGDDQLCRPLHAQTTVALLGCHEDSDGFDLPGERYLQTLGEILLDEVGDEHPMYVFTYPSYRSFVETGDALAARLLELRRDRQIGGFVIVGHSMGGLLARQVLVSPEGQDGAVDVPSLVKGIITLGTPHTGTTVASDDLAPGFFGNYSTVGLGSLVEGATNVSMPERLVNLRGFAYGGRVMAGLTAERCRFGYLLSRLRLDDEDEEENDCVVPLASALAPQTDARWAVRTFDYTHSELYKGENEAGSLSDDLFSNIVADIRTAVEPRDDVPVAVPDTLFTSNQFVRGNSLTAGAGRLGFIYENASFAAVVTAAATSGALQTLAGNVFRAIAGPVIVGGSAYWIDRTGTVPELKRVPVDGGTPEVLWAGTGLTVSSSSLIEDQGYLYFVTEAAGAVTDWRIRRLSLDGAEQTPVLAIAERPIFTVSNGTAFFATTSSNVINAVGVDGGTPHPITTGVPPVPTRLWVVGDSLYVASFMSSATSDGVISVAHVNGGTLSPRATGLYHPCDMVRAGPYVYVEDCRDTSTGRMGSIYRFRLTDFSRELVSRTSAWGGLALLDSRIYWTGHWLPGHAFFAVVSIPTATGPTEPPSESLPNRVEGTAGTVTSMIARDQNLFYTAGISAGDQIGYLRRFPLDGSAPTQLASRVLCPTQLEADGTYVYWRSNCQPGTIARVPIVGGEVDTLVSNLGASPGSFESFAGDASHLYFSARHGDNSVWIHRVPRAGGKVDSLVRSNSTAFDVHDDELYFEDAINGVIARMSVGGGSATVVAPDAVSMSPGSTDLQIVGETIYFANGAAILSVPVSGGQLVTRATRQGLPVRLTPDGSSLWVYWYVSSNDSQLVRYRLSDFEATLFPAIQACNPVFAVGAAAVYWPSRGEGQAFCDDDNNDVMSLMKHN